MTTGHAPYARPAAVAIVIRDAAEGEIDVLLGRRTPAARFLPDAWVFPGGAVEGDAADDAAYRETTRRELAEEVGLELTPDAELVLYDRLVTPEWSPVRFDTWFFLVPAPAGADAWPDGAEIVETAWIGPAEALRRAADEEMRLMPPTLVQLGQLTGFSGVSAALATCRGRAVAPRTVNVPPPGPPGPPR